MSKRDQLNTNLDNINNELTIGDAQKLIFGLRADEIMDDERPDHPEGTLVAEPFPIMSIIPDVTQPRKLIPSKIRSTWNGRPETIPGLLMHWHKQAENNFETIPIQKMLDGKHLLKEDELKEKNIPPITEEFLAVVSLAASIKGDGLINPITIAETGSPRKLVAGERRYLAYHLLNMFYQGQFAQIPAFQKKYSVWDQAAENGARRPLNAIGTASQIALLLMDLYQGVDGADFQPYHQLVVGENEQPYYAQVKNGYVYPIKKEFAQRILDVTGLKSANQVTQYRRLLDLPTDVWMQANEENWTEFGIRTYIQELNQPSEMLTAVNKFDDQESLTTVRLDNGDEPEEPKNKALSTAKLDELTKRFDKQYVRLSDGTIGKVWKVEADGKLQVMPPGAKFAMIVSADDVEGILNKKAYDELTKSPSPSASEASAMGRDLGRGEIKRATLSKGTRIVTKQGEILLIERPAFGNSDTYTCKSSSGRLKNIDFQDIAAIITGEESKEHLYNIDDVVFVRFGMNQLKATVKKIEEHIYTVFIHQSQKTLEVEEWLISANRDVNADDLLGQFVRTRTGHQGRVTAINGRYASVATINGEREHKLEDLEIITPTADETEAHSHTENEETELTSEPEFVFEEISDAVFAPLYLLAQFDKNDSAIKVLEELGTMRITDAIKLHGAGTFISITEAHIDVLADLTINILNYISNYCNEFKKFADKQIGGGQDD